MISTHRRLLACAIVLSLAAGDRLLAQGYINGVFVGTNDGPVELFAFAELSGSGIMRMAYGTLEDVPTVTNISRVLANIPTWKPGRMLFASEALFTDNRAERRDLRFGMRPLNINAIEVRMPQIEDREDLGRLIRAVRASEEAPAYLFVVMTSGGMARYYPVRIRLQH